MRNDAVIFDIDGTLWDASQASAEGWSSGLTKLGIEREISAADIRSVAGKPYETCVDILLPGIRMKYSGLVQTLNDCEMAAIKKKGGTFYDGAIEGVRELSLDFKMFLVSNCQEWYLDLFLGFSGLDKILAGSDCYGRSGATKEVMLNGLKRSYLLTSPVYIGDTASDETAAKLTGIDFVNVSWGFGEVEGRVKSVGSFKELLEYLQGK